LNGGWEKGKMEWDGRIDRIYSLSWKRGKEEGMGDPQDRKNGFGSGR